MRKIIDEHIIFLLCVVLMNPMNAGWSFIMLILIGLAFMELLVLFEKLENKWVKPVLIGIMAVLCVVVPDFFMFVPVLIYVLTDEKTKTWSWLLMLLIVIGAYNGNSTADFWTIFIVGAFGLFAYLLAYRTKLLDKTEETLIKTIDIDSERNIKLEMKNQELMNKQDYEVRLATLGERNRIAREIHDNVGHVLSRSILQVGALGTVYKDEPLHGQLLSINESLNDAMNSIRESVHDLHDESMDLKFAITEASRALGDNYSVSIDYDAKTEMSREYKYCFVAVVKEAISNIIKHSNGDKVEIIVREHPSFYQLLVSDNGIIDKKNTGLANKNTKDSGIGLYNIETRVRTLKGQCNFTSDNGFKIFVTLPKEDLN